MTTNLLIGYPDIPAAATITSNLTADTGYSFGNTVTGARGEGFRASASTTDTAYINYDLGDSDTKSASLLNIQRANLLYKNNVTGVVLRQCTQSAFVPTSVSGLIGWWDATRGITKDSSNRVSQWNDLSGNGNHATQGTGASQPLWVPASAGTNSNPHLYFDGARRITTAAISSVAQPRTQFVVSRTDVDPGGSQVVIMDGLDGSHRSGIGWTTTTNIRMFAGTAFNNTLASTYNTTAVYSALYNGASSQLWINGTSIGTGDAGSHGYTGSNFGSFGSGNFLTGTICEALVYSGALSSSDRQAIEEYLAAKWTTAPLKSDLWFSPFNLTRLKLWLDSRRDVTLTSAAVSTWGDLSGNHYDATQGTAAKRPLPTGSINGCRAITFDGTNDVIISSSYHPILSSGLSVSCAVKPSDVSTSRTFVACYEAAAPTQCRLIFYLTTSGAMGAMVMSDNITFIGRTAPTGSIAAGSTQIVTMTYDGGTASSGVKIYVNGVQKDNTNFASGSYAVPGTTTSPLEIGARDTVASTQFQGDMGEVIICESNWDSNTRALVEAYLTNKWITNPSIASPLLVGPQADDYKGAFSTSSATRHYWLQMHTNSTGSKYPFSKAYISNAFDFGRDPIWDDFAMTSELEEPQNREPKRKFSLKWLGITNAIRNSFFDKIYRYREVSPVILYDSNNAVFNGLTTIHASVINAEISNRTADTSDLRVDFEEVI